VSGPTKGMVAGQPIKTGDLTPEYEDNHARIFGTRKPVRGRWVWDEASGQMVEASEYRPASTGRLEISMDRHYENTGTLDGVDIGSRRKRETFMRDRGLADPRDFKGEWRRTEERKVAEHAVEGATPERVREVQDTVGRAAYELSKKRRR
jgi:hypothetical protein